MATPAPGPMQLTLISKAEEERLLTELKKTARSKCDEQIRAFLECAAGRSVSVAWACRAHNKAMNDCLHQHTSTKALDALKIDYILHRRPELVKEERASS